MNWVSGQEECHFPETRLPRTNPELGSQVSRQQERTLRAGLFHLHMDRTGYSSRNTCIGSTRAARNAGKSDAAAATTRTIRTTPDQVAASDGETP